MYYRSGKRRDVQRFAASSMSATSQSDHFSIAEVMPEPGGFKNLHFLEVTLYFQSELLTGMIFSMLAALRMGILIRLRDL